MAVEAFRNRGIVLFEDGSFRVFDLGDPEQPWPLAAYDRPRDLARFSGVRGFRSESRRWSRSAIT